jgi:2-(1,2-epoxy-1,2-dihydrophenyl)acetyl-CoA isomerase
MSSKVTESVQLEIRDGIAFLTFVRPNEANTIDMHFGREFVAAAFAIEAHSGVRAIVRNAKFVPAYAGVALTPDAGCTFFLPRVVGHKRAMELFLTNRVLDAEQALAWGLINEVVDSELLVTASHALAAKIAAGPRGAFGALKRLMNEAEPGLEAQLGRESRSIAERGASAEGREGIAAFLEKRPPLYK